jgi:hypothetical protein
MPIPIRSFFLAAAVAAGVCSGALATSSVAFEAQGYLLDIVVGGNGKPAVASLSMATPGSARGIDIPLQYVKVDAFDTAQQVLLLRFTNPGDLKLPKDFSLTVRRDAGVMQIDGKRLAGQFSWGM